MAEAQGNIISKSFTDHEVWKKMRLLKIKIKTLTKSFPADEKFRLFNQIIRSTRSVNACIAEGHGRFTFPERINFCVMARGWLSETYNHLIDAYDSIYISLETLIELKSELVEVEKILNGYINWLRQQANKRK